MFNFVLSFLNTFSQMLNRFRTTSEQHSLVMLETLIRKRYVLINLIPTIHTKMKKVVKLLSSSCTAYRFYFCVYLYSCRTIEQDLEVNIFMKKNIWKIRVCTTCCVLTLVLKYSLWNKSPSDFMYTPNITGEKSIVLSSILHRYSKGYTRSYGKRD